MGDNAFWLAEENFDLNGHVSTLDFWDISQHEVEVSTQRLIDLFFVNFEACGVKRFYYNHYDWCLHNAYDCYGLSGGVLTKILEDPVELVFKIINILQGVYE